MIKTLAGASVEFAGRVLSDPKGVMSNTPSGTKMPATPDLPAEVMSEIVEKTLHRLYAHWADEPIQILDNKTPRQAIKTAAGLERVKGLLRSYEEGEREQAAQQGRRPVSHDFLWLAIGRNTGTIETAPSPPSTVPLGVSHMQLDIFEHSRDVILRNASIEALRRRDANAAAQALAALAAEYDADPLLPALGRLCESLRTSRTSRTLITAPVTADTARAILEETRDVLTPAAQRVFGAAAPTWLAPLWVELATAIADYPFTPGAEELHAVPLLLRAGHWTDAAALVERIASWRRQPAPLGWMIEARSRSAGFATIWPLLAELAWMAPQRALALATRLDLAELDRMRHRFDAEFEGEGSADDFAWFPAWALLVDARQVEGLRLAQEGANTQAERCARVVLSLLTLERQGRHSELIEGRRKLKEMHPGLFARYMRDR